MGKYWKRKIIYFPNEKYPKRKIIYFLAIMCKPTCWFHGNDYLETSRGWIMPLVLWMSCAIPSTGLHKFDWAQDAWINPLSTCLNFLHEHLWWVWHGLDKCIFSIYFAITLSIFFLFWVLNILVILVNL